MMFHNQCCTMKWDDILIYQERSLQDWTLIYTIMCIARCDNIHEYLSRLITIFRKIRHEMKSIKWRELSLEKTWKVMKLSGHHTGRKCKWYSNSLSLSLNRHLVHSCSLQSNKVPNIGKFSNISSKRNWELGQVVRVSVPRAFWTVPGDYHLHSNFQSVIEGCSLASCRSRLTPRTPCWVNINNRK